MKHDLARTAQRQPRSSRLLTAPRPFLMCYCLIVISSCALLPSLSGFVHGDIRIYHAVAGDLFRGVLPYRDRVVEYPPYAILVFLMPYLLGQAAYQQIFMWLGLSVDWVIKLILLRMSLRQSATVRSLLAVCSYCLAVPFMRFFLLQRYDLWPALI